MSGNGRDPYLPESATVLKNDPMTAAENLFQLRLDSGRPLGHRPGQFVQVTVPGIGEAPISVSSAPGDAVPFELGIRRMGNVTGALHRLTPGQRVGIRGPFGSSFPVDTALKGQDIVFISGGCGLVPLRSAILHVLENREDYGRVTILFGCKSSKERLYREELAGWNARKDVRFLETVDKGDEAWRGNVGLITTLIPKVEMEPARTVALVCGPPVMYKFVLWELTQRNVAEDRIYISLERRMKCGVGKCGHCQVNGVTACQEGPVFRLSDVKGLKEAVS